MHELEILLVFRASSGVVLPLKAYAGIKTEAAERGLAYTYALTVQIGRQVQQFGAPAVVATQAVA